jgi:parallel beta-helix repeat protein/predicted outer membrane repeat protein
MPGTVFTFDSLYVFHVNGTLLANGTESDSIIFTTDTVANPIRWRGIRFDGSGSSGSQMTYCIVENGHRTGGMPNNYGGGIYCTSSSPTFAHCIIRNNRAQYGGGIYCTNSQASFTNCKVSGDSAAVGGGAYCTNSSPTFTDCEILNNKGNSGGGVYTYNSLVSFTDCVISGNVSTANGGGICCEQLSSLILTNCTLSDNSATEKGGAFLCYYSAPTFSQCTFEHNTAGDDGGACFCMEYSDPTFTDCDFSNNESHYGGGLFFVTSSGTLTNCAIRDNSATEKGGGVYCEEATTSFLHCDIQDNDAYWGGGVASWEASPSFTSCTFQSNSATTYGGGIYSWYSSATLTNCIVNSNWAQIGGGATCSGGSPSFTQCTLSGNGASSDGGGIYCGYSSPVFSNSVVAFSIGSGIYFAGSATSQMNYLDVFGNTGGDIGFSSNDSTNGPPGIGRMVATNANGDACDQYHNIFVTPMFADTASANCHLTAQSRCIGAGQSGGPNDDFDGNPRPNPAGSMPDIGAYESERATPTPMEGLIGYLSGALGPGTYRVIGDIVVNAGNSLRLFPGTRFVFYGAYAFTINGTLLAEGTVTDSIIFTGDTLASRVAWRGMHFWNSSSSASQLAYCRIEGGLATGTYPNNYGGGIGCFQGANPTIQHCLIRQNRAYCGGGLYCYYSSPVLSECTFYMNEATLNGGGVYCTESSLTMEDCDVRTNLAMMGGGFACMNATPTITHCSFKSNTASQKGGGIYSGISSSQFIGCTVDSNLANSYGGGICSGNDTAQFTDCIIRGNWSNSEGGGMYGNNTKTDIDHCLIVGNTASGNGGGVMLWNSCTGNLTNCTISGNTATFNAGGVYCYDSPVNVNSTIISFSTGSGVYFSSSSDANFKYCDIHGNSGGNITFNSSNPSHGPAGIGMLSGTNANGDSCDQYHNIFLNPVFVNAAAGDFHLQSSSPCIDAGDPGLPYDDDGTIADIGAFFYDYGFHPPSVFDLLSPQWGDTCWTLDTTLVWEAALDPDTGDAVTYEVWLDTLANFSTSWEIASALSDTAFVLEHLTDNYTYYWTVHASDLNTLGRWANDTLMLRAYYPEAPQEFALAEPPNDGTVNTQTPTLRWHKAFDPDPGDMIRYQLIWSYRSDFSVYEDTVIGDTSFTFPPEFLLARGNTESPLRVWRPTTARSGSGKLDEVEDDSTVYWKVKASDRFGFMASCNPEEGWSFHVYVCELPSAFSLLQPADSALISDNTVLCCWQASHDPDPDDTVTYTLRVTADELTFTYETDTDTCWILNLAEMGLIDENVIVEWWVEGHSNYPDTTLESISHFHFYPPSAVSDEDILLPEEFALHQNYPNPFNPMTAIRYDVPTPSEIRVMIVNLLGQEVATLASGRQLLGSHTVLWDATDWPSGIYLCRMDAGGFVQTRKMVLVK